MTLAEMEALARANVDLHLADAVAEDGEQSLFENAYVLAFDALHDAGVDNKTARAIAEVVASAFKGG